MTPESAAPEQGNGLQQPVSARRDVPVGKGKDRRASLVIKETAQLLDGLHQEADRSNALMAELEQLLASSQQASQRQVIPTSDGTEVVNFSVVRPLPDDVSGNEEGEEEEEEEEVEVQAEQQQLVQEIPPQLNISVSQKRRSSVVTFDGSSLFASAGPIGSPILTVQRSPSSRTPSFHLGGGKSFTEGHRVVMRRPSATDAGSRSNAVSLASASSVTRRPSGNDGCDASLPWTQSRRMSALLHGSAVPALSDQRSGGHYPSGSVDGTYEACGTASAPLAPLTPLTPAAGGGRSLSSPINGGGRFMKLIKGLFNSKHPQLSGHQLECLSSRETSMPQGPGALSSMTFSHTTQQLRMPSRHSFTNPSITPRTSGSPLVPTPPTEPQRVLQRSGNAAAAAGQGAVPGSLLVRSTSITSNGGMYSALTSPMGNVGPALSPTGSGAMATALNGNSFLGGGAGSLPLVADCRLVALPSRKNLSLTAVPVPQI